MGLSLSPGVRIGRYRVIRFMATGGEGDTYEATDSSSRKVVLKQLRFSVSSAAGAINRERARRLQRLVGKRHVSVCDLYEVFVHDDLLYVVMEYVEGETLDALLRRSGRLHVAELAPILRDVLNCLKWLHTQDFVHRDIKPANIMVVIEPDGTRSAKLIDLGIALDRTMPRLTSKSLLGPGTYEYAPPEVILGGDGAIDGRADLYSVGAVLFEALTGRLPFDGGPGIPLLKRIASPERPSMTAIVPDIPPELDNYVQRLMALKPTHRPASAESAWIEFQAVMGHARKGRTPDRLPLPSPLVFAHPASPCLRIESGVLVGTVITIPSRGITLGRNLLNPEDGAISRFHFRATATRSAIRLRDLGSFGGLVTVERRLRRAVLRPGDEITVGATLLRHV